MTNIAGSIMADEALQVPQVTAEQLSTNDQLCKKLGAQIRQFSPSFVYIVGRGSSDHAGVFAKYLIEVEAGIPVTSAAPSVTGIFNRDLKLENALVIVISQSGQSPDIINQVKMAKKSGAMCIGLVNDQASPLAQAVDHLIPLHAGEEKAVAATKSYLATLSAMLMLVAHWQQSQPLLEALKNVSQALDDTTRQPAQLSADFISSHRRLVILGRGFGYAIAREIALKLKEVCGAHAEAFSSAEFLHGPIALANEDLNVINVLVEDESMLLHQKQIAEVKSRGVPVLTLNHSQIGTHPRISALIVMLRFYLDVAEISVSLGKNPDSPAGLKKVTQTL